MSNVDIVSAFGDGDTFYVRDVRGNLFLHVVRGMTVYTAQEDEDFQNSIAPGESHEYKPFEYSKRCSVLVRRGKYAESCNFEEGASCHEVEE